MTLAHAQRTKLQMLPPQDVINSRLEHKPTRDSACNSSRPDDKRCILLLAMHRLQQQNDSIGSSMST